MLCANLPTSRFEYRRGARQNYNLSQSPRKMYRVRKVYTNLPKRGNRIDRKILLNTSKLIKTVNTAMNPIEQAIAVLETI
jgi:hypothetical protein